MSEIHAAQPADTARPRQHVASRESEPTGWVGWIVFAGAMMILLGTFQIIEGLVAVFKDGYYLVPKTGLVVQVDYTAWGWVHFGIGVAVLLAGLGLMLGQMWARVLGIVLAGTSAIVNLAFLAAYPVWSVIIIAFDVLVIYAVAVHGREMKVV
jgi:hypothetical protein